MAGGWPQWNDDQESALHREFIALAKVPAHKARAKIEALEQQHRGRRALIWAELGESPLACALEHLATIAELTKSGLAAGSTDDLATGYRTQGWRVDDGVIGALGVVDSPADLRAVTTAIRSVYLPWVEESARHLQKLVDGASYPGDACPTADVAPYGPRRLRSVCRRTAL